jgi:hypothetical protein
MKIRLITMALVAVIIGVIGLAPHAAGRQTTPSIDPVPVTASNHSGNKHFNGTWTINQFVVKDGDVFAEGTLVGDFTNKHGKVTKSIEQTVDLPVSVEQTTAVAGAANAFIAQQATTTPTTPGACNVLHLILGPITLNLLGLHLFIGGPNNTPLIVDLTAVASEGLLGQLLCGLAGGIPLNLSQLIQLVQLLNQLFGLLG